MPQVIHLFPVRGPRHHVGDLRAALLSTNS